MPYMYMYITLHVHVLYMYIISLIVVGLQQTEQCYVKPGFHPNTIACVWMETGLE